MGRLVSRAGLQAFLSRNIALRKSNTHARHTCVEAFRTLDDRVPFCLQVWHSCAFVFNDDRLVRVRLQAIGEQVYLHLNARRWRAMLFFHSEEEDETYNDIEADIPQYAKEFRQSLGRDNTLFDIPLHDPPTETDIDDLHQNIRRVQLLKQCGCGRAAALSDGATPSDMCVTCELTLTDTPDGTPDEDNCCLICLEAIAPAHRSSMECCQAQLHKGCREEHERRDVRCLHCRQCP